LLREEVLEEVGHAQWVMPKMLRPELNTLHGVTSADIIAGRCLWTVLLPMCPRRGR
jgi:hypothetical protein